MTAEPDNAADGDTGTGRRKAAAFLLALDSDTAAKVLRDLDETEVSLLSEEMSRLGQVSGEEIEGVLAEFTERAGADYPVPANLLDELLTKALGRDRAQGMLTRIRTRTRESEPFRSLRGLDAGRIRKLIKGEHPQVVAMVVSHLDPELANGVLGSLSPEERYEVIKRIATTEDMPVDLVRQVDEILDARVAELAVKGGTAAITERRFQTIAQVLNFADPGMTKAIIDQLNKELPAAATEIQSLMFVFEDLLKIDDRAIQKVLGEVEKGDLALALKTADQEISDKLLGNMSQRARDNMIEEMEMLGPRPLSEVEEAQKRILEVVKDLEERGDITVNRGGGEVMV